MEYAGPALMVSIDAVLRGQGADPAVLRNRRPELVEIAEQAIYLGKPLLDPKVCAKEFNVVQIRHAQIILEGGITLSGDLVTRELASAGRVVCLVGTIGRSVEALASQVYADNPSLSLALDGFGTAAVETLAANACRQWEVQAQAEGLQSTVPLSPGMIGWELGQGQKDIFNALQPDPEIVRLSSSGQMFPCKSTSFVIGLGSQFELKGSVCSYCSMESSCKYRSQHD